MGGLPLRLDNVNARLRATGLKTGRTLVLWLPVVFVFLCVAFVSEASHAQATYSPHYSQPIRFGTANSSSEYSAHFTSAGWQIFGINARNQVALRDDSDTGQSKQEAVVDRAGSYLSTPSMAWHGRDSLGAWVVNAGQQIEPLRIAFFQGTKWMRRTVTTQGVAEHPFVTAIPGRGYLVLFDWQRTLSRNFDIYAQRVGIQGDLVGGPRRLTKAPYYDFYPRAIWSDHRLFLVYLHVCCNDNDFQVVSQVLGPSLRPDYPSIILGQTQIATPPTQWGVDIKRRDDGEVVAAWLGDGVELAEWSSAGRLVFKRTLAPINIDLANPAVSLALLHASAVVYYTLSDVNNTYVGSTRFSYDGIGLGSDRVSYDQSSDDANPSADVLHGQPRLLWQSNGGSGPVVIEGSAYETKTHPTLVQRAGLGVGNPFFDVVTLVVIGLAAGLPLTIINAGIPLGLVVVSLVLGKFVSSRIAWPVYVGFVFIVLMLIFVLKTFANSWTFVIGGLGTPTAVVGVVGGVAAGTWLTSYGMRDEEPVYKAVVLVIACLFIISSAWAVGQVEAHITMI